MARQSRLWRGIGNAIRKPLKPKTRAVIKHMTSPRRLAGANRARLDGDVRALGDARRASAGRQVRLVIHSGGLIDAAISQHKLVVAACCLAA